MILNDRWYILTVFTILSIQKWGEQYLVVLRDKLWILSKLHAFAGIPLCGAVWRNALTGLQML